MLAREDPSELMAIFKLILDQIKVENHLNASEAENVNPNQAKEFKNKEIRDKTLLKSSIYALIGNLCMDKTLRLKFAND